MESVDDDRTFEEQMNDLGVKVERVNNKITAKAVTPWLKPWYYGEGCTKSFMRIRATYISLSEDIFTELLKLAGDDQVKLVLRVINYECKKALEFRYDAAGYAVHSHKRSWKITMPPKLKRVLTEHGVKEGAYKIERLKNGSYLAVLDDKK